MVQRMLRDMLPVKGELPGTMAAADNTLHADSERDHVSVENSSPHPVLCYLVAHP
jgi:hypothetical protein